MSALIRLLSPLSFAPATMYTQQQHGLFLASIKVHGHYAYSGARRQGCSSRSRQSLQFYQARIRPLPAVNTMFLPMYCPAPQPRFAPDSPITTGIAGMRAPCSQHTTPDNLDTEEERCWKGWERGCNSCDTWSAEFQCNSSNTPSVFTPSASQRRSTLAC